MHKNEIEIEKSNNIQKIKLNLHFKYKQYESKNR